MTILFIQPLAELDLLEIEHYSITTFGGKIAEIYMSDLEKAFDRLVDYPESGAVYADIRPPIRSVSVGKHRLFYDFDGMTIMVVRVLHQAMVPEDHP